MKAIFNLMDESINKLKGLRIRKIEGELIKCPNCGHEFDSVETFDWLIDENGHPTIEYLSCLKCSVATLSTFKCDMCPSQHKCTLDEECGATLSYPYNKWEVINTLK